MEINKEEYKKYADGRAPKSPMVKNCLCAFSVGGIICTLAQWLRNTYSAMGLDSECAGTLTSVTLIFAAVLLTGFGVFDSIAKAAGAGTLVPITGFANAVAAPAIDAASEGYISGVGMKIFTVSGPVILYGTVAGTLYGVILYVCSLF